MESKSLCRYLYLESLKKGENALETGSQIAALYCYIAEIALDCRIKKGGCIRTCVHNRWRSRWRICENIRRY